MSKYLDAIRDAQLKQQAPRPVVTVPVEDQYLETGVVELQELVEMLSTSKVGALLKKIIKEQIEVKKNKVWDIKIFNEEAGKLATFETGFGVGLEWVLDLENQLREEIENRVPKENESKDLQKSNK